MNLFEKYPYHVPLAISVALVMIAYPAIHPLIGAFGFIMSLVVSVMTSVLLSMASDASFATEADDGSTAYGESLAQKLADAEASRESAGSEYEDVDAIQEAYVDGEIDDVEFERALEAELETEIEVGADGRVRRVPDDDSDERTTTDAIAKQLRPPRSRVAETHDNDPRK